MKLRAVLSKTTTDRMKSKLLSEYLAEVVFECYMSPSEFARLIEEYNDKEIAIEITKAK